MNRWLTSGLILSIVGLLWFAADLVARAYAAASPSFDRIVGLSNVYAAALAAIGLAILLSDRLAASRDVDLTVEALRVAEDSIASRVMDEERARRAKLLGTDQPDTLSIDLVYEQLVTYRNVGGEPTGTLSTILDYYRRLLPGRMLIVGEPGSGKTVLAVHLLVLLLEARAHSQPGPPPPVPIRFALSTFDSARSFEAWVSEQIRARFRINSSVAAELVRRRRILPVLDGLDEMDAEGSTPVRARRALVELNQYLDGSTAAPVVVTCRTRSFETLELSLRDATQVEILPLNARQISTYLGKQMRGWDDELAWADVVEPLRTDPDGVTATALVRALRTPWLLTLAVTACRAGRPPTLLLPQAAERLQADHAERVEMELLGHFVSAAAALRRLRTGPAYDDGQVTRWLCSIAQHLASQESVGRSGSDIVLHTWWPIAGPNRTRQLHAVLAAMTVLLGIASVGSAIIDVRYLTWPYLVTHLEDIPNLELPFVVAVVLSLMGLVVLPSLVGLVAHQARPKPSRLDFRHLHTRPGMRRLMVGVLLGLLGGLAGGMLVGSAVGAASGFSAGSSFGLLYGALGGATAGLAFGVAFGLDRGAAEPVAPNDLIRGDVQHGLVFGVLVGLVAGVSGWVAVGPSYGLAIGIAVGIAYGLCVGPVSAVRYAVSMTISALSGRLPWRFNRFLVWATEAGLLRIAGIAYQFRHRQLQVWIMRQQP